MAGYQVAALFGHDGLHLSLSPGDAHGHIMVIPPKGEVDLPFRHGKIANPYFVDLGRKDRPTAPHPAFLRLHRQTKTGLEQQEHRCGGPCLWGARDRVAGGRPHRKARVICMGLHKVCRCDKRSRARCRHPWHFSWQWRGTRHRLSLDRYKGWQLTSKKAAEAVADEVRTAIRAGAFPPPPSTPQPETADAVTLDAYADIFLERYSKARQKQSWNSDRSILKRVTHFVLSDGGRFGAKAIGAVTHRLPTAPVEDELLAA